MKKLICFILAFLSILSLAGCGAGFEAKAVLLEGVEPESYAYAVKKGTNSEVITAVNEVIAELGEQKINQLVEYYLMIAGGESADCPVDLTPTGTGTALKAGTEASFAPFEFMVGTEVTGFDIAIMTLTANKLNRKLEVINYNSFSGMEAGVGIDFHIIAAGYTKTTEREQILDFSNTYFTSQQYIVCAKDKDFSQISDLKGLKIGVQTATTGDYLISDELDSGELADSGAIIMNFQSFTVAYLDLKRGTIDALIIDKLPAQMLINEQTMSVLESTLLAEGRYLLYLNGLLNTIIIAAGAMALGLILGALIAVVGYYNKRCGKLKILNKICNAYVFVVRGTPVMLQLLIMWFAVLVFIKQQLIVGIITFGLNSAAYISEMMRGAFSAVDVGQFEAGQSLGLAPRQTIGKIILPQSLKTATPSLLNEFISLVKETSVVGVIAITDLTNAASLIMSRTATAFAPLMVSAAIYLLLVGVLTVLTRLIERRMAKNDR